MKAAKTWALVLMGGGARGLAHVGVLRVLEKSGLVPDVVAGTSMGGIVGGCYAAGVPPARLTEWLSGLRFDPFAKRGAPPKLFNRPKNVFEYVLLEDTKNRFFGKLGLDRGDAVETALRSCVGDARIEDLPVKFVCNAVDLVTGREVLFTEGPLSAALRATMSLPLVFAPVRLGPRLLLDGGVVNSAPVEAARAMGAEVAVLVDVHRPLKRMPSVRVKSTLQIVQRAIEAAAAASFEERARAADFVIRIPVDFGILEFSEAGKIVAKGERAAAASLAALRAAIGAAPDGGRERRNG